MKTIIFLGLFAVLALNSVQGLYTDKYDNTNVKEILENPKLLHSYIKCGLDQGPCTEQAKELKSHIIDALENDCGECTEVQKGHLEEVFRHLIHKEREFWDQLVAKFDPQNKYSKKYEDRLSKLKEA
uniref:Chemosensory protein n=1 Tax=Histia rhodope TaxID=1453155 RepID=A0A6M9BQD4_9NEOP|nr:chemosensory protein [Histia rhodope]